MKLTLIMFGSFLVGFILPEAFAAFGKVPVVPATMNWVFAIGFTLLMAGIFAV